jgi:hypothetical protein
MYFICLIILNVSSLSWQIAAEIAAPISQCNKITMVSNGKGEIGASKLTGEILDIVARLPKAVESLTGIDISKVRILKNTKDHPMVIQCYNLEGKNTSL